MQEKRLDRAAILKHYRAHGPRATYLASSCDVTLSTDEKAKLVYVLPKYKLHLATDRQADMLAAMRLALATSETEVLRLSTGQTVATVGHVLFFLCACEAPNINRRQVRTACSHEKTGTYDVFRHMYLRQTFTAVFVTEQGSVVDTHVDYVRCGGYTEHSLFVGGLVSKDGLTPVPQGPEHSRPSKKRRTGSKAKRSEATKRMLAPPEDTKKEEPAPTDNMMPSGAEQYLPGLAADASKAAFLHFAGEKHADDDLCLAVNVRGARCRRRRSHGNFCKQHADSAASEEKGKAFFGEVEDHFARAAAAFERQQVAEAVAVSLRDSKEMAEKMARSRRVIQNRLDKLQLDRVETAADGSCQFVALTLSADIAMDAFAFRTQVVGYLRSTATLFKNDVDKSFPSFEAYLDCMARPQSWGDDLTLAAASHLLLRRIRVVSDHDLEVERFFSPPAIISKEIWGSDITVCHVMQNHYEATRPKGRGAKREL
ncbi:unnamed protein product [Symbiodinium sp. KB8]|nr:unnamed protein product [Symbiodinium sp. KB8]